MRLLLNRVAPIGMDHFETATGYHAASEGYLKSRV